MLLRDLAALLQAEIYPDAKAGDVELQSLGPIATAAPGQLTFVASADFEKHLPTTRAAAVIVATKHPGVKTPQLVHRNPYWAFAKAAQIFYAPKRPAPGISSKAVVEDGAKVDPSASVLPLAYVAKGARIGKNVVLHPGVYVGENAEIGDDCELRAGVVIESRVKIGARVLIHGNTVIGADGFGFAPGEGELAKIPQVGSVVIADDVEIGACATIDRGALEDTKIGKGTKLDSHIHIGHGTTLGENCMMCGLSGIAGSARLGNWVVMGGHAAINNKCVIPDGTQVGAVSAVTKSLTESGTYMGFPAVPANEWRRQVAGTRRLPELEKRVRELEANLKALKELLPAAP